MNPKRVLSFLLCAALLFGSLTAAAFAEKTASAASPEELLAGMSSEEKIAQMLMPAFRYYEDEQGEKQCVTEIRPEIEEMLEKYGFAGVIFFGENLSETEKAVRLVDAMQCANAAVPGRPQLLTAVDQEGGSVARLGHGVQMPGNMALGAIGDPKAAETAGRLLGEEISAVGLNYDAAPVVDINSNPNNPVIGLRSFSDHPQTVAEMGVALMHGLQSTGVISTLKHFPGHGDTATDSHTGLPMVEKSLAELKAFELIPFQACIDAGAEAIMTAHIQYPLIEKTTAVSVSTGEEISLPATLSKTILTDLLRGEMGFDGVIISDAMNMDAIANHFEPLTVAQMAINAGVNILLMPTATETSEDLAALEQYIHDVAALADEGVISMDRVDDSVLRILRLKEKHGLLEAYDGSDLEARVVSALASVGSEEHHCIEADLAARALTLLKNDNAVLPLRISDEKTLILVPFDSEVLSAAYAVDTLKAEGKLPETAEVQVAAYSTFQKADLQNVKHLIAVSAIYSLGEADPWTKAGAYSLLLDKVIDTVHAQGGDVTLVSAQLPYDADRYDAADAVVIAWYAKGMPQDPREAEGAAASYGPNLPAAFMQILDADGSFPGTLPVGVPKLDADGQFTGALAYQAETGAASVTAPPPADETPYASDGSDEQHIDEGTDTPIQILGYTAYGGAADSYFLSRGDKVAVISPASLPGKAQAEAVVAGLRRWGFLPVMGRHVYGQQRTVETCLQDLQWALTDPEIRAIFCVRGGYGSTEVMDVLPAELIADANKPIIGYSDITVYHAAWNAAGLPSIHASMSAAFGDLPEDCAEAELHMMNGALPVYQCKADRYCKEGTAEGILIGGNLSTFTATLDTAYDSTVLEQPYILFFEETGENMQHIHRYLTILKHKGILDNAAGIIFGEWVGLPASGAGNYGVDRGGPFASVADMISRQFLNDLNVPVAFGFPSGHAETNYPLLMGATARLEVERGSYSLYWPEVPEE